MKKQYNPFLDQYFLGGLMESLPQGGGSQLAGSGASMLSGLIPTNNKAGVTSIGGSAGKGALQGAASLSSLGPIGMIAGGVIGGVGGLLSGKKQQEEDLAQMKLAKDEATRTTLANMNYGAANGSNLPMAMGGLLNPLSVDTPIGYTTHFANGGTHESNPYGGIPQGKNAQGVLRTTEALESKVKFPDGDYIFSNRLTLE
jgi:hypothetical protein